MNNICSKNTYITTVCNFNYFNSLHKFINLLTLDFTDPKDFFVYLLSRLGLTQSHVLMVRDPLY